MAEYQSNTSNQRVMKERKVSLNFKKQVQALKEKEYQLRLKISSIALSLLVSKEQKRSYHYCIHHRWRVKSKHLPPFKLYYHNLDTRFKTTANVVTITPLLYICIILITYTLIFLQMIAHVIGYNLSLKLIAIYLLFGYSLLSYNHLCYTITVMLVITNLSLFKLSLTYHI
jgi:hypothetical protein